MKKINNKFNVVITCSWRFECLNIMLDILKSNFSSNVVTHVFCNLSKEMLNTHTSRIDYSLIDNFYHIPDKNCNSSITHKDEVRRRQPLDFFICTLNAISANTDIDDFVYTECDFFPIDEVSYFRHLKKVDKVNFCAGKIIKQDLISAKTPKGYLCMSPLYFSNNKTMIRKLINDLIKNRANYLYSGYAFEGMVCESLSNINCEVQSTSRYFISNYEIDKNLDPETLTTHQHNPLNLKGILKKRNITAGKHISKLLSSDRLDEAYTQKSLESELDENFVIIPQSNQLR